MKVTRLGFVLVACAAFAGCGPQIPPAGVYASVIGRFTDASSGLGIAGVTITVNASQSAMSDASGNYRVGNVPTGPWSYAVFPPSGYAAPPGSTASAPLAPGETRTLDITLNRS